MADDGLVLVREDPKECEQIHSLKKIQLKEWSMVVIRDSPTHDDCSIFPPINHENLPISEQHPLSPSSSSSSSSSPSSSSPPPNPFSSSSSLSSSPSDSTASDPQPAPPPSSNSQVKRAGEVTRWIGLGSRSYVVRFLPWFPRSEIMMPPKGHSGHLAPSRRRRRRRRCFGCCSCRLGSGGDEWRVRVVCYRPLRRKMRLVFN